MDKRSAVRRLAEKIARDLFTEGGTPRVATRLVMEHAGRLGTGWCERAVADRIEDHLRVALIALAEDDHHAVITEAGRAALR